MTPIFLLHISSSWVEIRLHTKNQPSSLPGSALKVCGGVVVVVVGWVTDQLCGHTNSLNSVELGCDNYSEPSVCGG